MKLIYERMEQSALRMEQVLLLAGMLNDLDSLSDPLKDFLDDEDDDTVIRAFPDIPLDLMTAREDSGRDWAYSFAEWAHDEGKVGFLIQFARPVMKWSAGGKSSSYTWGYYNTTWIYADTLELAVEEGLAWADGRESAEKAELDQSTTQQGGA